jgi:hypothetical protein
VRVRRPDQGHAEHERREPTAPPPHGARVLALQRGAGNQAVARAIELNPDELGVVTYDTEPGDGTDQDLDDVVDAVMVASTGLTRNSVVSRACTPAGSGMARRR